jgi:hypothetical protein
MLRAVLMPFGLRAPIGAETWSIDSDRLGQYSPNSGHRRPDIVPAVVCSWPEELVGFGSKSVISTRI